MVTKKLKSHLIIWLRYMKTVDKINTILASLILLLFCSNSIAKEVRGKSILSYEGSYKKNTVIDLINIGRDKACEDALKIGLEKLVTSLRE